MMLPRQLTWLHLLPSDSSFECSTGPAWLREPLATRASNDGQKTLVAFNQTAGDLPELSSKRDFVGLNCRGVSTGQLQTAGFSHVARFAVLPSWDNPRWFIPLASPRIASAGFNLYTPARISARLKRFAARVAVYSRLPFWYRDELVIARREASPLEQAMSRLFPLKQLSFALSAGAPEGARNRKASAAVIDSSGQIVAFLKLAGSDLATALLRHEAETLRGLALEPGVRDLVPRLLTAEEIDGTYFTAQAPLPGGPAPTAITPLHLRLLDQLTPRSGSLSETQLVQNLPGRIAELPSAHPELGAALENVLNTLGSQQIRVGAIHGDFAPWNFRLHQGKISAFDWEYGCLDGPAGLDEIHYRLQVGLLLDNWTVERAIQEFNNPAILDRYLSHPSVAGRHALIARYLIDILTRLYAEGYDHSNDMVEWNERLLSHLQFTAPGRIEALLA